MERKTFPHGRLPSVSEVFDEGVELGGTPDTIYVVVEDGETGTEHIAVLILAPNDHVPIGAVSLAAMRKHRVHQNLSVDVVVAPVLGVVALIPADAFVEDPDADRRRNGQCLMDPLFAKGAALESA